MKLVATMAVLISLASTGCGPRARAAVGGGLIVAASGTFWNGEFGDSLERAADLEPSATPEIVAGALLLTGVVMLASAFVDGPSTTSTAATPPANEPVLADPPLVNAP